MKPKPCRNCGEPFSPIRSVEKYCSPPCMKEGKRTTVRDPVRIKRRFMAKVRMTDTCWVWIGATAPTGYGNFWDGWKYEAAHRASYAMFVGPIPSELCIDHLCRNRGCVNPEHLEAVTHKENVYRGAHPYIRQKLAGVCRRGHKLDADNTYVDPSGRPHCRACTRIWRQARRERMAA